jgi:hypothetical protein
MKQFYCIVLSGMIFLSSNAQPESQEITHYLFPEFIQGVILMKTGKKSETLLNYNSLTEEMIFENNGRKLAIARNELALTDTVFIGDKRFIALNHSFVELVYHSGWDLYVEHRCNLVEKGKQAGYGGTSNTSANRSISSFSSNGNFYELKLPDGYEVKPYIRYWLKENGDLKAFNNLRELKKIFKEKEDLFREFVKKHGVKYDDQESVIQLIEYLEYIST